MKTVILIMSSLFILSCENKEEKIKQEIQLLEKEYKQIQKVGNDLVEENKGIIEFRFKKQIASNDENYPTPKEDKEIESNLKKIDSLANKGNLILKKIDSLEVLIKK